LAFKNGNLLKGDCDSKVSFSNGLCDGYIVGVADTMAGGDTINGFRACFPSDVTAKQVLDVARQYLDQNPAQRHSTAVGLLAKALEEAFPCKK
jgi:hypothetical protein